MWVVGAGLLVTWFVLKFVMHKGGYIPLLLIAGISLLVIQFVTYRKTRYHRLSSGR
jgi:hypothetical protein